VEENKLKGAVFEKLGEASTWILRYIPRPEESLALLRLVEALWGLVDADHPDLTVRR
jgi:hypothetical protein